MVSSRTCVCVCVCVRACVCVCSTFEPHRIDQGVRNEEKGHVRLCLSLREKERESARQKEEDREGQRERGREIIR